MIVPRGTAAVIIVVPRPVYSAPNHTAATFAGAFAKQNAIPPKDCPIKVNQNASFIQTLTHPPIINSKVPI